MGATIGSSRGGFDSIAVFHAQPPSFLVGSCRSHPGRLFLRRCAGRKHGGALGCHQWSILLSGVLTSSSGWRTSSMISSLSCMYGGSLGFLEGVFLSEKRKIFIWRISYFCAGTSSSSLRVLWKVAWTIELCPCEVFSDRQIFVCFSIGNLLGRSGRERANLSVFFFQKKQIQMSDRS